MEYKLWIVEEFSSDGKLRRQTPVFAASSEDASLKYQDLQSTYDRGTLKMGGLSLKVSPLKLL